jgi:hypothetical protein
MPIIFFDQMLGERAMEPVEDFGEALRFLIAVRVVAQGGLNTLLAMERRWTQNPSAMSPRGLLHASSEVPELRCCWSAPSQSGRGYLFHRSGISGRQGYSYVASRNGYSVVSLHIGKPQ